MHRFHGFVDLRMNSRQRESDASFWPSFTDIMTVILMVFMLTMILVIVKNSHLAERIRLSQELQAAAELETASALDELAAMAARSTDLEDQMRGYNMQIILLNDEVDRLEEVVDAKLAIIEGLADENEELLARIRTIRLQLADKDEELDAAVLSMEEIQDATREAEREMREELAALLAQLRDKDAALITLSDEKSDLELALARNRQDLSSLEDKYLKLVRPARSAAGKAVASVSIARVDGAIRYEYQGPRDANKRTMPLDELHRLLAAAKEELGAELYVKVVIPDNSGLSYNEAWAFTKEILTAYDYYYKDGW